MQKGVWERVKEGESECRRQVLSPHIEDSQTLRFHVKVDVIERGKYREIADDHMGLDVFDGLHGFTTHLTFVRFTSIFLRHLPPSPLLAGCMSRLGLLLQKC